MAWSVRQSDQSGIDRLAAWLVYEAVSGDDEPGFVVASSKLDKRGSQLFNGVYRRLRRANPNHMPGGTKMARQTL